LTNNWIARSFPISFAHNPRANLVPPPPRPRRQTRFHQQPEVYKHFLEILHTYQREQRTIKQACLTDPIVALRQRSNNLDAQMTPRLHNVEKGLDGTVLGRHAEPWPAVCYIEKFAISDFHNSEIMMHS
jgi:hypothetical protein